MKSCVAIIFLSFCLCGCAALGLDAFFDSGYYNKYGQYVPKRPKFRLKNKKNNVIPNNLDTVNAYCSYFEFEYPTRNKIGSITKGKTYYKFYPNGRCLQFNVFESERLLKKNALSEKSFDPNDGGVDKRYYFSKDGINIKIEHFWKDGYGRYDIEHFYLSQNGDTLVDKSNSLTRRYIRQEIPKHWKKYKVDW
jgi:hypothetical protein